MDKKNKHYSTLVGIMLTTGIIAGFTGEKNNAVAAINTPTKAIKPTNIVIDSIAVEEFKQKMYLLQPRTIDVVRTETGVLYTFSNGESIERSGGTIAWRNNNPGCIRYTDKTAKMGAIGIANNFAIFPDEATGMRAIRTLLLSDSYRNLTIDAAINKYAPSHENNTEHYISVLCRKVNLPRTTKLCDMNEEQLDCIVKTIRKIEGWVVGTEKLNSQIKRINDTNRATFATNKAKENMTCYALDYSI